jgi:trans-2,3-dihydro-3-hydroxyanthranilate isomerase
MTTLSYHTVDVFTQTPLEGNPLAVFLDGRGLAADRMQRIARELNLSETTFLFPPERGGAARVRIFTPGRELPFAGHPTLGTAAVMRRVGLVGADVASFALEEGVGPVAVRVDGDRDPLLWLTTPPISLGAAVDRAGCARALGLDDDDLLAGVPCRVVSAGNANVFIALASPAAVDRARVDSAAMRAVLDGLGAVSLFAFAPAPFGAYSRMFPGGEYGIAEDPATGSATGPLAAFMMVYGLAARTAGTRFVSEQGTKMGRRSILHVLINGEGGATSIEVGGHVVPVAVAEMQLPD